MNEQAQSQRFCIPGATSQGVVCSEGVILASEKRVSYGYMVMSKAGKKVFKIADSVLTQLRLCHHVFERY